MARQTYRIGGDTFGLKFTVDDDELSLKFGRFANRLSDFRRFWYTVFAPQFFEDVQRNFQTEGRSVGRWRALSPRYAAWKLRTYGRLPILQRTGRLIESWRIGGRGNYLRAWRKSAEFGSTVRYSRFHQHGTSRMPARPIAWVASARVYQPLLNQYLREEHRAAMRGGAA